VSHGIYPTSPREIINKGYKVVITSNRCHLGRFPNIRVNIIKNLLGAINYSAEFHLGLLTDKVMLTKFQFAGLGTFKQTFLC